MKNKLIFGLAFIALITLSVGCNSHSTETKKEEMRTDVYECPMKCNGATYDKPGKCTVCGMDLQKVAKG